MAGRPRDGIRGCHRRFRSGSDTVRKRSDDPLLTRRELDVLRLLTEGHSDREIAARLYISRRTAATHVAAVLRKLDVTSRAAAAAFAVRNGLV